jgi:hypothetical protein
MDPLILGLSLFMILSPLVGYVLISSDLSPYTKLVIGGAFTAVVAGLPMLLLIFGSKVGL